MSRNFELLQKLGKEQEILHPVPTEVPTASVAAPARLASSPTAAAPAAVAVAPALDRTGLEEADGIVQQLFLLPAENPPRTVVFVSTEPGAGCTWVCSHVADVLATRIAGTVCLVDANLRDPGLHQVFGVENYRGLSEALLQPDPIRGFARPLGMPNLWMISAGSSRDAAQTFLVSDRMRLRLNELRAEFDFILIDSSAMNLGSDACGVGSLADGVVLVLKANASRKENAREFVEELQAAKANVLGAVLNRRTFPIPEKLYKKL
jgi:succinoglycan biosynthesis transport protein ExoP